MKKVIITGGTGFLGRSLAKHLSEHYYEVVTIGRTDPGADFPFRFVTWNGFERGGWEQELTAIISNHSDNKQHFNTSLELTVVRL